MCTKENGTSTRLKEEALMNTWMVQSTSATGKKTDSTVTVLKHGQTMPNMKEIMSTERSTESAPSNGQTDQATSVNSTIIISTEKESIPGQTPEFTKVNGVQTKCMGKERLPGLTEGSTSESTLRTKNEATVNSSGQTAGAIEENGSMESSMEKEHTLPAPAKKNTENGRTEKEFVGSVAASKIDNYN